MKKKGCLILLFLSICFYTGKAQSNVIQFGFLLDSVLVDSAKINGTFIPSIDIAPNKSIVLSTQNKLYALGWLGIQSISKSISPSISSFAFTHDSVLMLVVEKDIMIKDTVGIFNSIAKLPVANMGISRGGEVMYLYDRNAIAGKTKYAIYALAHGGKYKKLLSSPQPITGVVEMNKQLYIAIGSGIYTINLSNNELQLVAGMQKDMPINSLTVDYVNDIIYFTTSEGIYAWSNNQLAYVTGDFGGGIIQYFDNGILLFNPSTKDLLRITGISAKVKIDF